MEFYTVDEPGHLEELFIIPISDTHIGDGEFDERELKKTLEKGAQIGALFLLNGDIVNNGIKSSVSSCYGECIPPGDPQIDYAVTLFRPYRELIIGSVEGNHERRSRKDVNINPARAIANMLNVPYFGEDVLLQVRFGMKPNKKPCAYTLYATHGWAGGRTVGGKVNSLSSLGRVVVSDIYVMSHVHQISAHTERIYVPDQRNQNVMERDQWYVSSGAYLGRSGYARSNGYAPQRTGSPVIRLDGRERRVEVTL